MIRIPESVTIHLADALSVPDGGFTVRPLGLTDVRTGYAVSPYPQFEHCIADVVTPDDIERYLADHTSALAEPHTLFGGWRNPEDGLAYLDVSVLIPARASALIVAREAGQSTIWDFRTCSSVLVRDHEDRRVVDTAPQLASETGLNLTRR